MVTVPVNSYKRQSTANRALLKGEGEWETTVNPGRKVPHAKHGVLPQPLLMRSPVGGFLQTLHASLLLFHSNELLTELPGGLRNRHLSVNTVSGELLLSEPQKPISPAH